MSTRPLFVPLRTEWFAAFRSGSKRVEWRAYGPRWNRQVAHRGRDITLSHGYSGARLHGTVVRTRRVSANHAPAGARALYPDATHFCAIHVVLDSDGMSKSRRAAA
jgi:hypothetical protein